MDINAYTLIKKINSTRQPADSGTSYSVRMKESTSMENPVFILQGGIDPNINYVSAFGKYYFIDDIVLITNDIVELHCSIDVLATHKTAIGDYMAYIDRSAYEYDADLIDESLSAEQKIINEYTASTDLFDVDITGCYLVRTTSPGTTSATGIATWIMNNSDIKRFLDFLTTESNFDDVLEDSVVKSFFNPFQYVLGIKWFPFSKNDIGGTDTAMRLGWWSPGSFKLLTSKSYYNIKSLNIPNNYYLSGYRRFDRSYTRLNADICGIGTIELDPMLLDPLSVPGIRTSIDYITGEMKITFLKRGTQGGVTTTKDVYGSYSGIIGIDVPVGQVAGMSAPTISAAAGMSVFDAALSGLVASTADIIGGIKNVISPNTSYIGGAGNIASIISNPRLLLYIRNYGCSEFPLTVNGRPLRKNRKISTLPGYIKCLKASLDLAAPDTETKQVNDYLNSGFYYE